VDDIVKSLARTSHRTSFSLSCVCNTIGRQTRNGSITLREILVGPDACLDFEALYQFWKPSCITLLPDSSLSKHFIPRYFYPQFGYDRLLGLSGLIITLIPLISIETAQSSILGLCKTSKNILFTHFVALQSSLVIRRTGHYLDSFISD